MARRQFEFESFLKFLSTGTPFMLNASVKLNSHNTFQIACRHGTCQVNH